MSLVVKQKDKTVVEKITEMKISFYRYRSIILGQTTIQFLLYYYTGQTHEIIAWVWTKRTALLIFAVNWLASRHGWFCCIALCMMWKIIWTSLALYAYSHKNMHHTHTFILASFPNQLLTWKTWSYLKEKKVAYNRLIVWCPFTMHFTKWVYLPAGSERVRFTVMYIVTPCFTYIRRGFKL